MKLLLAEDEEDIQRVASLALRRGQFEVVVAKDGEECLTLAEQEHPDVILLDVLMPKLNGLDACRRLKANAATKDIPIIFLSASTQEHQMQKGLQMGAIGYLPKPFDPLQLPQQVRELLEKASSSPG